MIFNTVKNRLEMSEIETLELIQHLTENLANKKRHSQNVTFHSFPVTMQYDNGQTAPSVFQFFME
jgi:hypothetical protein